ncbi:hypothetical protein JD844_005123, partial [Phrynosoma platyrhinos]
MPWHFTWQHWNSQLARPELLSRIFFPCASREFLVVLNGETFGQSNAFLCPQFQEGILDICLSILDQSLSHCKYPISELRRHNDPIYVGRVLSAMVRPALRTSFLAVCEWTWWTQRLLRQDEAVLSASKGPDPGQVPGGGGGGPSVRKESQWTLCVLWGPGGQGSGVGGSSAPKDLQSSEGPQNGLDRKDGCWGIDSNDDNGVLEGNWSDDYSGGEHPNSWTGSGRILRKWESSGFQAVRYGQCWVYAGVLAT